MGIVSFSTPNTYYVVDFNVWKFSFLNINDILIPKKRHHTVAECFDSKWGMQKFHRLILTRGEKPWEVIFQFRHWIIQYKL